MLHAVITTIQRPTSSVKALAARIATCGGHLVIAGDSKGPADFDLSGVTDFRDEQLTFLSLDKQQRSEFALARLLPTKHYARKNLGYLQAIVSGATQIYETDDDNAPLPTWRVREERVAQTRVVEASGAEGPRWVNVFRQFSDELIWPRGLPLDRIHHAATRVTTVGGERWAPIQQGLADGSPDVDAIWRLVLDREFRFKTDESVYLPPGNWCPFNTQTTWYWPVAYPLLYVPSYCSFRMCDIWKSFVAQRCIWELETGIVYHASEVWQERNLHNLMRDFEDEVPGYRENHRIAKILEDTTLQRGVEQVGENVKRCYRALVAHEIFPERELSLVDAWIEDLNTSRPTTTCALNA